MSPELVDPTLRLPVSMSDNTLHRLASAASTTPHEGSVKAVKATLPIHQEKDESPTTRVGFFDPRIAGLRQKYLREFLPGCIALTLAIFAFFSIFWGALYKAPVRHLDGMVVVCDVSSFVSATVFRNVYLSARTLMGVILAQTFPAL